MLIYNFFLFSSLFQIKRNVKGFTTTGKIFKVHKITKICDNEICVKVIAKVTFDSILAGLEIATWKAQRGPILLIPIFEGII